MSLPKRMADRRRSDAELERTLGVPKNDPTREAYGGIRYSRADIEALEEERAPWLKAKRRRDNPR